MNGHASKPVVAIVGRPNVGKSTLFNRIVGRRVAIVEDTPGVTRDRNYHEVERGGRTVLLVDTGGFEPDNPDRLMQQVRDQARLAIDEADAVIFVVDGIQGPTAVDQEIADLLRRSGKSVFLAVNKIDSPKREVRGAFSEFFGLGFGHVAPVSAEHARGVDDLFDAVVASLPEPLAIEEPAEELEEGERPIRLAIVGRPNVGKSTLVNQLIGEERLITSPVAGTTRDPVDAELEFEGRHFVLTDTAGIRRKRSIAMRMEAFSVFRAFQAVERSDVVAVLIDATEPAVEQDLRILGLADERSKPVIVVVNKWDQVEASEEKREAFLELLDRRLPFLSFAPRVFISALTGSKVNSVLRHAMRLHDQASTRLPTPLLNRVLQEISGHHALPVVRGVRARLYYIAQVGIRPPTLVIQTNHPELIPDAYRRHVQNRIRDTFDLQVPIRLVFKRKASLRPRTAGKKAFQGKRRTAGRPGSRKPRR